VRGELRIHPVADVSEVLDLALEPTGQVDHHGELAPRNLTSG
jgi:hypothetical protein